VICVLHALVTLASIRTAATNLDLGQQRESGLDRVATALVAGGACATRDARGASALAGESLTVPSSVPESRAARDCESEGAWYDAAAGVCDPQSP
jgi:hypothetical protein